MTPQNRCRFRTQEGRTGRTIARSTLSKSYAQEAASSTSNPEAQLVINRFVLTLPEEEFQLIQPHISFVDLTSYLSLNHRQRTVPFAYFPNFGLISIVVELRDGKSVEARVISNDGASGMSAVLGLGKNALREIVQIVGKWFSGGSPYACQCLVIGRAVSKDHRPLCCWFRNANLSSRLQQAP